MMGLCEHPGGCQMNAGAAAQARCRWNGVAYCRNHYTRAKRNGGDPGAAGGRRFLRDVMCEHPDGCQIANGLAAPAYICRDGLALCAAHYQRARRDDGELGPGGGTRRKYAYDADIFAEPLSGGELWLLGLLMADGCVDRRGGCIQIGLVADDRDALESARTIAGSDAPLRRRNEPVSPTGRPARPQLRWALHSVEVCERAAALGLVPAKSRRDDVEVPEHVASSPHFWRGLIDGDGSIAWRLSGKDRPDQRLPLVAVLGGKLLLNQWAAFVSATIGGEPPNVHRHRGTRRLYATSLSGARAWDVLQALYRDDGPALERKRRIALEILATPRPVPRRIPSDEVARALALLNGLRLRDVPQAYVCSVTGVRLGGILGRARRGARRDLHALFDGFDPDWRIPRDRRIPAALVADALAELGPRSLATLSGAYVCARTGIRLGQLVNNAARHGQRPDLHALFEAHEPAWSVRRSGGPR